MEKRISIENIGLFESERLVNTPLSLEACRREGIAPEDLLYKPLEFFEQDNLGYDIQRLYFYFFKKKRENLIEIVKETKKRIIEEENRILRSKSSCILIEDKKISDKFKKSETRLIQSIKNILNKETNAIENLSTRHQEFLNQQKLHQDRIYEQQKQSKITFAN